MTKFKLTDKGCAITGERLYACGAVISVGVLDNGQVDMTWGGQQKASADKHSDGV